MSPITLYRSIPIQDYEGEAGTPKAKKDIGAEAPSLSRKQAYKKLATAALSLRAGTRAMISLSHQSSESQQHARGKVIAP